MFGKKDKQIKQLKQDLNKSKIEAKFAAAQTTRDNYRHWADADNFNADRAYNSQTRKTIRERARLELENNSYARGMILTYANDVVGKHPKLQILTNNKTFNSKVEKIWDRWAKEIKLGDKLRTAFMSKVVDGEVFAVLSSNPRLKSPIKLDIQLIECDRVAEQYVTTTTISADPTYVDGIKLDKWGNPLYYDILKYHPGSAISTYETERINSEYMLHFFKMMRPEQHRGVSEIAPALPLFADLRRYTLAVIAAAESAADFAAVIQSDTMPEDGATPEPMDTIPLEKRMATVLPQGWSIGQVKSEQPTTVYSDFKRSILQEIARCLNIPYNVAAGDSSGHNFSSAKMDSRMYEREIEINQYQLTSHLDKIFNMFKMELDKELGISVEDIDYKWMFSEADTIEPKEISAFIEKIDNNLMSLEDYYSKLGEDWEVQLNQIAREKALLKELGLNKDEIIVNNSNQNEYNNKESDNVSDNVEDEQDTEEDVDE